MNQIRNKTHAFRAVIPFFLSILPLTAMSDSVDEVIILGQKIESSLQDTKESVAVLTSKDIHRRGLVDLQAALNQVAGVSTNGDDFQVRGIGGGATGGAGTGDLTSYYIDGVAITGRAKTQGPSGMWDVAQVEVLRGPQSTNLGQNALAGAVIVHTVEPSYENETAFRLGRGNYHSYEYSGMGNLTLSEGVSALRFSVDKNYNDGDTHNVTLDQDDYAFRENITVRGKWLYESGDRFKAMLSTQYVKVEQGSVLVNSQRVKPELRLSFANVDGLTTNKSTLVSLDVHYDFSDTWSLRSISSSFKGDVYRLADYDRIEIDGGHLDRKGEDTNWAQEIRFNYSSDTLSGSTGFYAAKVESFSFNDDLRFVNLAAVGVPQLFIDFGLYPEMGDLTSIGSIDSHIANAAFFTEWDWAIGERWSLSGGFRYDEESQDIFTSIENTSENSASLPEPSLYTNVPGVGDLSEPIALINASLLAYTAPVADEGYQTTYDAFLPQFGVTFDITEDVSTSFFVKRGYRSGGVELVQSERSIFDPEYLTNYEFALRSILLEGKVTLNANMYYGQWTDQQVGIPVIPGSFIKVTENAGESEISGIEVESELLLTDNFSVFLNAAYNTTEFVDFVLEDEVDLKGKQFAFAPQVTGSIGGTYYLNDLFFHSNIGYQGDSFGDVSNDPDFKLDARTLVNFRLGYEGGVYSVIAYVKNAFDTDYVQNNFLNNNRSFSGLGARRAVGIQLSYQVQ